MQSVRLRLQKKQLRNFPKHYNLFHLNNLLLFKLEAELQSGTKFERSQIPKTLVLPTSSTRSNFERIKSTFKKQQTDKMGHWARSFCLPCLLFPNSKGEHHS
uniref:Uncharacterized protein n=1 Tax=Tolypothrix bouteillei VB521301 TaxID=1479485 RepID=A0A0C1QSG9_9CYAN